MRITRTASPIMRVWRIAALVIAVAALSGCEVSEEEIKATCVEILHTRLMDGAVRIRMLRDIGVPADLLEKTEEYIILIYRAKIPNGVNTCVRTIQSALGQ